MLNIAVMGQFARLSPQVKVHMDEAWFKISSADHFWIKRRFEVFKFLWGRRPFASSVGEVGCGHGLVLRQIEETFGTVVDGYELNEAALNEADSKFGRLFYYNIHDQSPSLRQKYELIFLFDVIEHLEDDAGFIESVLFHLREEGCLVINVPANQALYSDYDRVQGHQRRYDLGMIKRLAGDRGLQIEAWSYWGLPYIPLLLLRQMALKNTADAEVSQKGFGLKSALSNRLLLLLGRLEFLPNHWSGTSLLAILKRKS